MNDGQLQNSLPAKQEVTVKMIRISNLHAIKGISLAADNIIQHAPDEVARRIFAEVAYPCERVLGDPGVTHVLLLPQEVCMVLMKELKRIAIAGNDVSSTVRARTFLEGMGF